MVVASRKWALAAGAAALLSSQAVWAAPVSSSPSIDPLVSLSIFSGPDSRAAVCGTGNACVLPASMGAAAAATSPAVAGTAASAAAAQGPGDHGYGLDLPGLFVLFAVPVAIVLAIALEGNGNNHRTVSPA
jgi:hypothetical protein